MPIQIRVVIPGSGEASESDGVGDQEDAPKTNVPQADRSSGRIPSARRGVTVRPASAPVRRTLVRVPVKPHDIAMHVASIYDVQNEHDYIMDKALQAYTKHRLNEQEGGMEGEGEEGGGGRGEEGGIIEGAEEEEEGRTPTRPQSSPRYIRQYYNNINNNNHHHHHNNATNNNADLIRRRRLFSASSCGSSNDGRASPTSSTASSSARSSSDRKKSLGGFKLALCTLKDAMGNEPPPVPHAYSSPGPGYLPLKRPWSALPSGRLDAIREVSLANNVVESSRTARPVHQHRLPSTGRSASAAVPTFSRMDPPITRSNAYHIRNRTTHSWAAASPTSPPPSSFGEDPPGPGSSSSLSSRVVLPIDPMTMSCPNARTLEEHMRNARVFHGVPRDPNPSPVIVKGRASIVSPSSPQPIPPAAFSASSGRGERPVSAYSYDGGLFLSAGNSGGKDYFVIHPDWVSEAMTVQKLSLNERQSRSAVRTVGPAAGRRDYYGRRRVGGGGGGGRGAERSMEEDGEGAEVGSRRVRRCKSAPPAKHRNPITWSS